MNPGERQPEAWERQPDEGAKAFRAFSIYRDLGTNRSLLKTSQIYSGTPSATRPAGRLSEWSRKYNWIERAAMWDAYQDDIRRAAELKKEEERAEVWAERRMEVREKGWDLFQRLVARAEEILEIAVTKKTETEVLVKEELDEKTGNKIQFITRNVTIEPLGVRARDAALIGRVAVELGRLAAGLSNGGGLSDLDVTALSEEELKALAAGKHIARLKG